MGVNLEPRPLRPEVLAAPMWYIDNINLRYHSVSIAITLMCMTIR
jgi:hypothetical protein